VAHTTQSRIMRAKAISRLFLDHRKSCTSAVPTLDRSLMLRGYAATASVSKGHAEEPKPVA